MADDRYSFTFRHCKPLIIQDYCSWPYDKTYWTHSRSWDMEIMTTLGWKCHTQPAPSCDIFNLGSSYPTHYRGPVWARGRCRISPPRFLAECCNRQLNQFSFVLLYFRLSTFSDLYWVWLTVFFCTVLFVSISQVIGCEDRLRNDLYCVEWGVKLYSNQRYNPWLTIGKYWWVSVTSRVDFLFCVFICTVSGLRFQQNTGAYRIVNYKIKPR